MKIYTRTGDNGTTSLVGGKRVAKNSARLEAYGTIDEFNSALGLMCAHSPIADHTELTTLIHTIQSRLFDIGAYLATDNSENPDLQPTGLSQADIDTLERHIDTITPQLPPLHTFILPGGCVAAGHAHICRTVCRRAERRVLTLAETETVSPIVITYLNRLSDWLFIIARYANHLTHTAETPWIPD